jgi:hypothetical protein
MSEAEQEVQRLQRLARHKQTIVIAVSLLAVFLLLACGLSALAVQQRLVPPPAFLIRLGPVEFAAPCPPQMTVCDESTPFYAIWHGVQLPNGTMRYRYLFFIYLASERPDRHP